MPVHNYDLFVIGGGSAGVRAARVAARHGARVGIAEKDRFGGTCVIRGCVPKKLMVHAARFSRNFRDAAHFGWQLQSAQFTWADLMTAKDRQVAYLEGRYAEVLEEAGVILHRDRASLVEGPVGILSADGAIVRAGKFLLAVGAAPFVDSAIPGAEHGITSDDLFKLTLLPRRMVIIGGGYIAVEFASLLNGLGADVTLVVRGAQILGAFDADAGRFLEELLIRRGVQILHDASLHRIERQGEERVVVLADGTRIVSDQVLFATGRRPNTRGLGLERCGVALDQQGRVEVAADFLTSAPGIYSVGDASNEDNLTPVAIREGQAFADTQFGGIPSTVDYSLIPTVVFSTPECGKIGLTEEEAQARPGAIDVYETRFVPLTAWLTEHREKMLIKMIVDRASQRVLGVHLVGAAASEMVQLLAIPLRMGATKQDIDAVMAVHPTSAEELVTLRHKRPDRPPTSVTGAVAPIP